MWDPLRGLVSGSVHQQSGNSCTATRFVVGGGDFAEQRSVLLCAALCGLVVLWWFRTTAVSSDSVLRCVGLLSCGDSGQPQTVQILPYVVWTCCLVMIPDSSSQFRFCPTLRGLVVLVVIPDNRSQFRFCVLHCVDFICDSVLLQPADLPCRALTGLFASCADSVKR